MNIKYATLVLLFVTSIMATRMSMEQMKEVLIASEGEALERNFNKLVKEQVDKRLRNALSEMAMNEKHILKVVRCLEMINDSNPDEKSNVWVIVHSIVNYISYATRDDTEAFANAVASLKPSALKPLASIRYDILLRKDVRKVLERIMAKSPELIIGSLPIWLATHGFDQSSRGYKDFESTSKQAFRYLVSLATRDNLSEALDTAKKNEHYKVNSQVYCCGSEKSSPSDLISQLEALLGLVQGRKEFFRAILALLPTSLIDLIDSYLTVDGLFAEIPSIKENTNGSQPKSCLVM